MAPLLAIVARFRRSILFKRLYDVLQVAISLATPPLQNLMQ